MTPTLRDVLRQYVEKGGILVCGDSLFLDENESFVGTEFVEPLAGCTFETDEAKLTCLHHPVGRIAGLRDYHR